MIQETATLETRENDSYIDRELLYTKFMLKIMDLHEKLKDSNQHSIEFLESYAPIEKEK